jgi:predicted peroxiredoxin
MASRRSFLKSTGHACAAFLIGGTLSAEQGAQTTVTGQKFLLIGLTGSENPTRANFPFVWSIALHEAGNEVKIELAGDATVLMRTVVANNITAVGWPPFREALAKVIEHKIPIYV